METKQTKKTKRKSGSIVTRKGKIYARIRFTDDAGKPRDLWRAAKNREDAQEKIKELIKDAESKTSQELDASTMTFDQLADWYCDTYLHEAIYVNERKISGIRNIKPNEYNIKCLRNYFGNRLIQSITHSDLLAYKLNRIKTPTKSGKQRAIASLNRELQMMRRLMNLSDRNGWIKKSPFLNGDSLISQADENQRIRILSFPEESRLFTAIDSSSLRFWLKGAVLIALDCAFRRNEILTLKRKDVDLINRTITIRAFNSKTAKTRSVGLTNRVYKWLAQFEDFDAEDKIFPIKNINTSWQRSLKEANISDYHFHDNRATCISRMIAAGLPHTEVMRIGGWTTLSCLYRYIRIDDSAIHRAANVLDDYLMKAQTNIAETSVFIN